jgi:hypothetical protein
MGSIHLVVATLETEIAKAAGADPVAESVRLYGQLKSEVTLRALVSELIQHANHRLLGPNAEKPYAETLDPRDVIIAEVKTPRRSPNMRAPRLVIALANG